MKLDFTIESSDDRAEFVRQHNIDNASQHALETFANYILFGKDPLDKHGAPISDPNLYTNAAQRKEIQFETKYKTWARKPVESLDELCESPTFDVPETQQTHYKTARPEFAREVEYDIPTIQEYWAAIDAHAAALERPNLPAEKRYVLRHNLIEMRRQQYTMRDIFKPRRAPNLSLHPLAFVREGDLEMDIALAPLGFYTPGDLRFERPLALANEVDNWGYDARAPIIIDMRESDHVRALIEHRLEIETYCADTSVSVFPLILDTLDFFIEAAQLNAPQLDIIAARGARLNNAAIAQLINQKYGYSHTPNYISTRFTRICGAIAHAATRAYDYYYARINPSLFKQCMCCGQTKLRDHYEFTRRARSPDGFVNKCKECEKAARRRRNEEKTAAQQH